MLMLLVHSAAFDISEHRILGGRRHLGVIVSLLRAPEFHVKWPSMQAPQAFMWFCLLIQGALLALEN